KPGVYVAEAMLQDRKRYKSVVNIGKREIYRHTNNVSYSREKTTAAIFRLSENFYSMTPLLMRIYEGIETGVYLYSADSYRNAKTLQRLTNSLWKVYLGQNMELSRSFSRLITRVHQENKSVELRNAENNMFSDNRSLKNLVNALRKAFSGSNLELRNSIISLFGDIHKAGNRKNIAVNKRYDLRSVVGIIMLHMEIVPEYGHIRLEHRIPARLDRPEQTDAYSRFEREIKTKLNRLETSPPTTSRTSSAEDIVRDVLEKVNRKQQLDWRLEKLQRGIF
ncbi:MAG: riboflavin kinase, partial [Oscillospiraceae bacterium]|nr:riboflavin kinase [Oscillospiraceae bacterium]